MKEVTTILTVQITCIDKHIEDENFVGFSEKELAKAIQACTAADDVLVTSYKAFERDESEQKAEQKGCHYCRSGKIYHGKMLQCTYCTENTIGLLSLDAEFCPKCGRKL